METHGPTDIAKMLGVDPTMVVGTQDWQPDTHAYTISELVVGDQAVPFRVRDMTTKEVWTKILDEPYIVDPAKVDSIFASVMVIQVLKNGEFIPAIEAAIPALSSDLSNQTLSLVVNGQPMVGDLVNGTITNIRPPSVRPTFSVDAKGSLVADLSAMTPADQAAASAALQATKSASQISIVAPAVVSTSPPIIAPPAAVN